MTEDDILYEKGDYWVCRGKAGGFEVWKNTITHAERVTTVGGNGKDALTLAVQDCDRRAAGIQ